MLPKIWKKVLLAVCIVACIFNVMSKLVNRHSLEINLKSVNDGKTIWDPLHKEENKEDDKVENIYESNTSDDSYIEEKENEDIEENNQEDNYYSDDNGFVVEL